MATSRKWSDYQGYNGTNKCWLNVLKHSLGYRNSSRVLTCHRRIHWSGNALCEQFSHVISILISRKGNDCFLQGLWFHCMDAAVGWMHRKWLSVFPHFSLTGQFLFGFWAFHSFWCCYILFSQWTRSKRARWCLIKTHTIFLQQEDTFFSYFLLIRK